MLAGAARKRIDTYQELAIVQEDLPTLPLIPDIIRFSHAVALPIRNALMQIFSHTYHSPSPGSTRSTNFSLSSFCLLPIDTAIA